MEKQSSDAERGGLYLGTENKDVTRAAVKEMLSAAEKYLDKNIKLCDVLDVGSGTGNYSYELLKHVHGVVGVEPFKVGYEYSINKYKKTRNLHFHNYHIEDFETKKKFDLIVALTVIEHMENQKKAFKKIFSLLKEGGMVYITAPNKYWLFEQHYGLPFLSWLPLPIANKYLQLIKSVKSYKDCSYSLGYTQTKRFLKQFTSHVDFLLPFDQENSYLNCGKSQPIHKFIKKLGIKLISLNPFFWNFSKGFIIVIRK